MDRRPTRHRTVTASAPRERMRANPLPRPRRSGGLGPLAALVSAALVACGAQPVATFQRDVSELKTPNGVSLNGVSLNGVSLNGVSLNGVSLNGVSLNGVSLNGVSLNGVSLNGSNLNGALLNGVSLNGVSLNGVSLNGVSLNGVTMGGLLSDGTTLPLRIEGVRQGTATDSDVYFYRVSYQASVGWSGICGNESTGQAAEAIALAGRWNYAQGVTGGGSWVNDPAAITFACMGKALAKCVLFGYKPWKTVASTNLRNHHQACTRMLRADYCGNGQPYTVDGTPINVYDNLGIELDTQGWNKEAQWTPSGAMCVQNATALRLQLTGLPVPSCVSSRVVASCGKDFKDGELLISEYGE